MKNMLFVLGPMGAAAACFAAIAAGHGDGVALFAVLLFLSLVALYFAPSMVAYERGRTNAGQILVLNIFGGWTLFGWVFALVWAFGDTAKAPAQ